MTMRSAFLRCAVSLALVVTAVPAAEPGPSAAGAQSSAPAGVSSPSSEWVKRLQRKPIADKPARELFGSASWQRPVKPVAAARPAPPPVPYVFMGRMSQQGSSEIIFLTKGDQIYKVTEAGDVLDGVYRVDEVAANHIALTYLPLNAKQIVTFAASAATTQKPGASAQPAATPMPIATRDVIAPDQPAAMTVPIATRDVISPAPASSNRPAFAQALDSHPSAPSAAVTPAAKP
jgi:hypothetical protein